MSNRAKSSEPRKPHYLRLWREYRGLTLPQMEAATLPDKISKATLSRIERGLQPYSQDTLEICARVLDVEPGFLLLCPPTDPRLWLAIDDIRPEDRALAEELIQRLRAANTAPPKASASTTHVAALATLGR